MTPWMLTLRLEPLISMLFVVTIPYLKVQEYHIRKSGLLEFEFLLDRRFYHFKSFFGCRLEYSSCSKKETADCTFDARTKLFLGSGCVTLFFWNHQCRAEARRELGHDRGAMAD
ncbi:hypothetical protein BJY01DRAFT_221057 [Aspergillus pseudoustus]|uniref:Secreted protein n=1 Tax=Aspergillus pseudoustus TaxID=1810923 RepID=A0ABR4JC65_9EURO